VLCTQNSYGTNFFFLKYFCKDNAKMPNPSPSERGARIGHFWPPLMVLEVSILVYTAIALGAVQRLFQTHGSDWPDLGGAFGQPLNRRLTSMKGRNPISCLLAFSKRTRRSRRKCPRATMQVQFKLVCVSQTAFTNLYTSKQFPSFQWIASSYSR
jgi:hypothetical protein